MKNEFEKGKLNLITDVNDIMVGHFTVDDEKNTTGITIIMPNKDIVNNNLIAASHIINGYGKTIGTSQIDELGTIESPIVLTNTLSIGVVSDLLIKYIIENNKNIKTFNPIVAECNDSYLNNIQNIRLKEEDFKKAVEDIRKNFKQGDIGAGKGMSCHQLKGGIGSSSRMVNFDNEKYTVGVLVLSNHGRLEDLTIYGDNIGKRINPIENEENEENHGSAVFIIATDIPLSNRQLKRISKRISVSLARTGSYISHGSGEIVIAFSTANKIIKTQNEINTFKFLKEEKLEKVFRMVVEAGEESIINSLLKSKTVKGSTGKTRKSLGEYL